MLDLHVGLIGAGHMAGALVRAFVKILPAENITLSCPDPELLAPFEAMGCRTCCDNTGTVASSELTILAVRPGVIETVLREISPVCGGKCLLSVAAGVSIGFIQSLLPGAHVMRAMPNTPASVGLGAAALAISPDVPPEISNAAVALFESAGIVELMPEALFDTVTALSGSGPAYFFRMAAVMADWAHTRGMEYGAALRFAAQTMAGSAAMIESSGKSPGRLASDVAVPGGTTRAAFDVFDSRLWDDGLRAAMDGCAGRAAELGR